MYLKVIMYSCMETVFSKWICTVLVIIVCVTCSFLYYCCCIINLLIPFDCCVTAFVGGRSFGGIALQGLAMDSTSGIQAVLTDLLPDLLKCTRMGPCVSPFDQPKYVQNYSQFTH